MEEVIKILLGIGVLILGYFLGNLARKMTEDEQKDGRKYFVILTAFGLGFGLTGLIVGKDWLMFSSFFVAIFASRSLVKKRE